MKSFDAGSVLKQSDYKKKLGEVALIAALCIDVLTFFVLKLAGVI